MSSENLEEGFTVALPFDADGYLDRQCPVDSCSGFFKIKPGTGLPDVSDCGCPYCGTRAELYLFNTEAQREYVLESGAQTISEAMSNQFASMMKGLRSKHLKVTVQRSEKERIIYPHIPLPTKLVCSSCACSFKITGTRGLCPGCGLLNGGEAA